jgi:cation diffusion facilitator CzcD-associated flavoprotein CzcO
VKKTFRRIPAAQKLVRGLLYTYMEAFATAYVLEPRLGRLRERGCKRYLYRTISDPAMRAKLTPNYRVGCKRILISSDYLPTLRRPHVTLVAEALTELREMSIITASGSELEVDVVIFATGFESPEQKPPVEAIGLGGRSLHAVMTSSPKAYLGATLPGFPNMFLILGPNTGLGHSSMIYMMESQFRYVVDAMKKSRAHGWSFADLKPEVMERYQRWVQERLKRTVWNAGGCASWYLSKEGKNFISWPDFTFAFRLKTRRFDDENYNRHATAR